MPSPDMCEFEAWGETPTQLQIMALNIATEFFQCKPEEIALQVPIVAKPKYQNSTTGQVYTWEAYITAERITPPL